jgi:hypothetical protein
VVTGRNAITNPVCQVPVSLGSEERIPVVQPDPESVRGFQNIHQNIKHARSQKAGCYLTGTSAYLTDPIYTIPRFQMLPHALTVLTSTHDLRHMCPHCLIRAAKLRSACEPGTTNLISLTEIAVSLPFLALSHDITCGHCFPSLHCVPFLSAFSAPLPVRPVKR